MNLPDRLVQRPQIGSRVFIYDIPIQDNAIQFHGINAPHQLWKCIHRQTPIGILEHLLPLRDHIIVRDLCPRDNDMAVVDHQITVTTLDTLNRNIDPVHILNRIMRSQLLKDLFSGARLNLTAQTDP